MDLQAKKGNKCMTLDFKRASLAKLASLCNTAYISSDKGTEVVQDVRPHMGRHYWNPSVVSQVP